MTRIDAGAVPTVAIEFMNEDHQEAVELLNLLLEALSEGTEDEVTASLQNFYVHNREHFAREEEQMLRVNFPPYGCHKGEHDRVLAEIKEVIERWETDADREALLNYINHTVLDWFMNHINTMDTVTAMFISQQSA